jgi:RimJ/RimL family protein N-acetyltransferase
MIVSKGSRVRSDDRRDATNDALDIVQTRRVMLAPLRTAEDHQWAFRLATASGVADRWFLRGEPEITFESFMQAMHHMALSRLIVGRSNALPLAHAVCFDLDLRHRHASVGVAADPSVHGTGLALEGLGLFILDILRRFDLRKLYAEAISYNLPQYASGAGRWYDIEGCLTAHEYVDGEYWDVYVLAIDRHKFLELVASKRWGKVSRGLSQTVDAD